MPRLAKSSQAGLIPGRLRIMHDTFKASLAIPAVASAFLALACSTPTRAEDSRTAKKVTNADGSSVESKPDGTNVITTANGGSVTKKPDGSEIVVNSDGTSQTTK